MSRTLNLIFLGTNYFYDSPQSLIKLYHENTVSENKLLKLSGSVQFTKKLKNALIEVKLTELKTTAIIIK